MTRSDFEGTYSKLNNGEWGIRLRDVPTDLRIGEEVKVSLRKKDGNSGGVRTAKVIWIGADKFYDGFTALCQVVTSGASKGAPQSSADHPDQQDRDKAVERLRSTVELIEESDKLINEFAQTARAYAVKMNKLITEMKNDDF